MRISTGVQTCALPICSQRGAGAVAAEQGGERVRVRFAVAAAGDGARVEIDRFQSAVEVQDGACGFGGVDQGDVELPPADRPDHLAVVAPVRSEERSEGKEWVSTCRYGGSPCH